jgi:hypothetical protein
MTHDELRPQPDRLPEVDRTTPHHAKVAQYSRAPVGALDVRQWNFAFSFMAEYADEGPNELYAGNDGEQFGWLDRVLKTYTSESKEHWRKVRQP